MNELSGARRTGPAIVSGMKSAVGALLDEVLLDFAKREAEVGIKVSRATVGTQLVPQQRLLHNYKVVCDFVLSVSKSSVLVSPKLLRRVFGFRQSTAENYLKDMQLDVKFLKRLSVADAKVVRARAGTNKKVDVTKLRRVWGNKIIHQNTKSE